MFSVICAVLANNIGRINYTSDSPMTATSSLPVISGLLRIHDVVCIKTTPSYLKKLVQFTITVNISGQYYRYAATSGTPQLIRSQSARLSSARNMHVQSIPMCEQGFLNNLGA
jgi:hypothetical protein